MTFKNSPIHFFSLGIFLLKGFVVGGLTKFPGSRVQ